jgi:hypothetical protein
MIYIHKNGAVVDRFGHIIDNDWTCQVEAESSEEARRKLEAEFRKQHKNVKPGGGVYFYSPITIKCK